MDALNTVKMAALAASQYASCVNENTKAQLQRHIEVLLALLKTNEVNAFLKNSNASRKCIISLVNILENFNKNKEVMCTIFKFFIAVLDLPFSRKLLFENVDLNTLLFKYLVEHMEYESLDSLQECLLLLEKTTWNCRMCEMPCILDKFLNCLLKEILKDESKHATICLGILSNLVSSNIAVQAQVKGMLSSSNLKQLINYLRKDSIPNKINFLSIVTFICWDDDLGKNFFSIKNVTQTMKLLFSQLTVDENSFTQQRAGDIFIELLKHDEIAQQISIYDSEHNIVFKLLKSLEKDFKTSTTFKLLEVLLGFCQISTIRHRLCLKMLECHTLWKVLLKIAATPLSKTDEEPSVVAVKLIGELCEEINDSNIEILDCSWFTSLLSLLRMYLVPINAEDNSFFSILVINSELAKILKLILILNLFSTDEKLTCQIAQAIDYDNFFSLLQGQMTFNLFDIVQNVQEEFTYLSISVVLHGLWLARNLKSYDTNFEKLLYSSLQDSKIIPFLAKAMTGFDRSQMQVALRLHQEALPLPSFPSIQLAETVCYFNEKTKKSKTSANLSNCRSDFSSFVNDKNVLSLQTATINTSRSKKSDVSVSHDIKNSTDNEDKENIQSLIATIQNVSPEESNVDVKVSNKTSQIVTLYENKLSSILTIKNNLQDLLEAKTLALSQADRIINQHRVQIAKTEEDARKMAGILQASETCCERLTETVKTLESDKSTMERDLQTVVEENQNLHKVADHYDKMQVAYQDNLYKIEVLERNLKTLRQEYDTLKELHDMVQRHSEKLKQQHNQMTVRLEEVEEDRMKLLKRVSDLESSVSDLTQLVEEQDRATQVLVQEKNDCDLALKSSKSQVSKLEELTKELKIKESQLSHSVSEKEDEILCLKQTLDKQSQTLSMITELANSKHQTK